ncbi:hypothetical protein HI914_02245 [Erysiphe necator]|nr:hypothetical protein HI914_02245 [Erysiphe necator]
MMGISFRDLYLDSTWLQISVVEKVVVMDSSRMLTVAMLVFVFLVTYDMFVAFTVKHRTSKGYTTSHTTKPTRIPKEM